MGKLAIQVEDVSKQYFIGQHNPYRTLRESLSTTFGQSLRRVRSALHPMSNGRPRVAASDKHIWALKDVSFEVERGEVLGIIGPNGAGKSTLLKIMSRITEPTEGFVKLYGRVGSLLEVGTGFHPELSGRENIYLNGAILGMSRREIRAKFDEIVSFAEMARFVDTPVKHYSSGMFVRLAFSVAAHLDPEILLVDEVLAVGDLEFQRKCLGKIRDVVKSGRTVLFVSHNMVAVRNLCTRAILIRHGRVICHGDVDACVRAYTSAGLAELGSSWQRPSLAPEVPLAIEHVAVELTGEQPYHQLHAQVQLTTRSPHRPAFIALDILDATGTVVMQALPTLEGCIKDTVPHHRLHIAIDLPPLIPGKYGITVWVGSHNTHTYDEVHECTSFEITQSPTPNRTFPHTLDHGHIVPLADLAYMPEEQGRAEIEAARLDTQYSDATGRGSD
jgi:lipopolysaccharide transport system ATP-binding protein